jgi:hypothetical protein
MFDQHIASLDSVEHHSVERGRRHGAAQHRDYLPISTSYSITHSTSTIPRFHRALHDRMRPRPRRGIERGGERQPRHDRIGGHGEHRIAARRQRHRGRRPIALAITADVRARNRYGVVERDHRPQHAPQIYWHCKGTRQLEQRLHQLRRALQLARRRISESPYGREIARAARGTTSYHFQIHGEPVQRVPYLVRRPIRQSLQLLEPEARRPVA